MLGEMVIGAFKHAGRRRMAFRVGTKMAKFHRSVRERRERREISTFIVIVFVALHVSQMLVWCVATVQKLCAITS